MKNILLTLLISLGFVGNVAAQETEIHEPKKRDNYFYVGPFDLFLNTLQLGYERKLKNHNTIAFTGSFRLSKKDEIINRLGGSGEFQYRVNLLYNKEAISAVAKKYSTFAYFAPYLQYRYEEITDPVFDGDSQALQKTTYVNSGFGGLGFGFRLTALENRFCLNLYAGGGLKYSDVHGDKRYADFMEAGYTGIAPKVAFQIGIAF